MRALSEQNPLYVGWRLTASTTPEQEAAAKGVSEEERAAQLAAEKERRMQDIISAITVLASSSGKRGKQLQTRAGNCRQSAGVS